MNNNTSETKSGNDVPLFLRTGGEMGALISDYDWSQTSLGNISSWPLSLKINLGNILHSGFPMFLFWGENNICFYNDAYRPSLGQYGKHPAIGKHANTVWPEIWDFISGLINSVYETGQSQLYEDLLLPINRNGSLEDVYWTFSYSPAYNGTGHIEGVMVTCIDTTKAVVLREKVNQTVVERTRQLEDANKYLQDIINSSKQPLQVLEPVFDDGKIIDFRFKITNEAYAQYTGQSTQAIRNKRVSEIFPGYLKTSSFFNVVKTFETGATDTWTIHYDQDGLDLYNEMTALKMGDQIILHFTDFTQLKYLELELLKNIEELKLSNQNLEAFAHAASHDLKEPIRKIQIYASKLRTNWTGPLNFFDEGALVKVENASLRMNNLINDILLFSEFHLLPIDKEEVNLTRIVSDVIDDLEILIQDKGAIINVEPLPIVMGFAKQLHQLFQNLISNALKYSRPNEPPQISIVANKQVKEEKPYHRIEVTDKGIGFDKQYSEKIFQLFTRLHGNSSYTGSGIGLSIVKKVVDNHNGIIEVESTPGHGSAFRVFLKDYEKEN